MKSIAHGPFVFEAVDPGSLLLVYFAFFGRNVLSRNVGEFSPALESFMAL